MDQAKINRAVKTIPPGIEEHNPINVCALVSGGNDSAEAGQLAARHGPGVAAKLQQKQEMQEYVG